MRHWTSIQGGDRLRGEIRDLVRFTGRRAPDECQGVGDTLWGWRCRTRQELPDHVDELGALADEEITRPDAAPARPLCSATPRAGAMPPHLLLDCFAAKRTLILARRKALDHMKGKLRTVTAAILCADEAVTPRFPPRGPLVLAAKMGDMRQP